MIIGVLMFNAKKRNSLIVRLAEGHLCANIFAHRDESDSNHSERGRLRRVWILPLHPFSPLDAVMWSSQWWKFPWNIAWIISRFGER
jgi:hypothetical protein